MKWRVDNWGEGTCLEVLYKRLYSSKKVRLMFYTVLTKEAIAYAETNMPDLDISIEVADSGSAFILTTATSFTGKYKRALVTNYVRRVRDFMQGGEHLSKYEEDFKFLKTLTSRSGVLSSKFSWCNGDQSYIGRLPLFLEQFEKFKNTPIQEVKIKSALLVSLKQNTHNYLGSLYDVKDVVLYNHHSEIPTPMPDTLLLSLDHGSTKRDIPYPRGSWNYWVTWCCTENRLFHDKGRSIITIEGEVFYTNWTGIPRLRTEMPGSYYEEMQRRYNILENQEILLYIDDPGSSHALEEIERLIKVSLRKRRIE